MPGVIPGLSRAPYLRVSMREDGRRIRVSGTVQGVGFRPWVYRVAQSHGVAGRVSNGAAGARGGTAKAGPAGAALYAGRRAGRQGAGAGALTVESLSIPKLKSRRGRHRRAGS